MDIVSTFSAGFNILSRKKKLWTETWSISQSQKKLKIGPMIKIRIGPDTGLFGAVTGYPPIEGLTDGFVMGEFGYKF